MKKKLLLALLPLCLTSCGEEKHTFEWYCIEEIKHYDFYENCEFEYYYTTKCNSMRETEWNLILEIDVVYYNNETHKNYKDTWLCGGTCKYDYIVVEQYTFASGEITNFDCDMLYSVEL